MKFVLGLLALLLCGPAHAQQTKAQLTTAVTTDFPDNTSGLITPAIVRSFLNTSIASWQQALRVRANTGTTDTIAVGDYGYLVTESNSSPVAVALPQATTTFATFNFTISNLNTGLVTITPTTSTINGTSTYTVPAGTSVTVVSDGANWQVIAGTGISALTGDVTASGAGSVAATLATVNINVGSFGSASAVPAFTVNAKGLITAASSTAVVAPAGTLSGTTLASNVVTSSLTTVGALASGSLAVGFTPVTVPLGGTGAATFTSNLPLIGNGTGAVAQGTLSGNTTKFATASGTLTSGDCVAFDASGNVVSAGGPCTVGGGGGTVTSATAGQLAWYSATGTTVVGNTVIGQYSSKIGIGTTSPAWLLDVGTGSGQQVVQVNGGGSGTAGGGAFYAAEGGTLKYAFGSYSAIYGGSYSATASLYASGRPLDIDSSSVRARAFGVGAIVSDASGNLKANGVIESAAYGCVGDGSTNNDTCVTNMLAACPDYCSIHFGPGAFKINSAHTYTFSNSTQQSLVIYGEGDSTTRLLYGATDGWIIDWSATQYAGFDMRDLSLETSASGSGTAVTLNRGGSGAQCPLVWGSNNFTNIAIYHTWTNGIYSNAVNDVVTIGLTYVNGSSSVGTGVYVLGDASCTQVYTYISGATMAGGQYSVHVGYNTQGVYVVNSSITFAGTAILLDGGAIDNVSISNSQFDNTGYFIFAGAPVVHLMLSNNLAYVRSGGVAVSFQSAATGSSCIISGNVLANFGGGTTYGIVSDTHMGSETCLVQGNTFSGHSIGIWGTASSADIWAHGNLYPGTSTPVLNSGSNNIGAQSANYFGYFPP